MRNEVNLIYLEAVLGNLEYGEYETGKTLDINADDQASTNETFSKWILPWFKIRRLGSKVMIKVTLAYYLQRHTLDAEDIFSKIPDLAFRLPSDSQLFFTWLWETLFPDEDYHQIDTSDCIESTDIMKMNDLI